MGIEITCNVLNFSGGISSDLYFLRAPKLQKNIKNFVQKIGEGYN